MACCFEGYAVGLERHLHPVARILGVPAGAAVLAPELTSSLIGLGVVVLIFAVTKILPPRPGPHDTKGTTSRDATDGTDVQSPSGASVAERWAGPSTTPAG